MNAAAALHAIVAENRAGRARGIPSWCTAHPQTLGAILAAYRDDDEPILIEATCNQVNQDGGYTGMTPAGFRRFDDDRDTALLGQDTIEFGDLRQQRDDIDVRES